METLKRITYISNFSESMSHLDVERIGETSVKNNRRDNLTGSLLCFRGIFYQILEGPADKVDECYARIAADKRHTDIYVLKLEKDVTERHYSDWSMKTIILDESSDPMMQPMKDLLSSFQENHRILEKYAPLTVIKGLQQGENPLNWKFRDVEKVVLFADIVASTTFTEILPMSEITRLLDVFYGIINGEISLAGGTVAKLTGDGLMAYFDGDQADAALEAATRTLERLAELRARADSRWSPLLYSGIGISAGRVVTGSIGSDLKRDYTLLGDSVNTAARLEGVTRKTGYGLIFDEAVRERLKDSSELARVGVYQPKGKEQKVTIYTARPEQTRFDRSPAEIKAAIRALGAARPAPVLA